MLWERSAEADSQMCMIGPPYMQDRVQYSLVDRVVVTRETLHTCTVQ